MKKCDRIYTVSAPPPPPPSAFFIEILFWKDFPAFLFDGIEVQVAKLKSGDEGDKIIEITSASVFLFTFTHMFSHTHARTAAQLIKARFKHIHKDTHVHALTYTGPSA